MTRYAVARLEEIEECTTGANRFDLSGTTSASRPSVSTRGRPPRWETGSSTSTTSRTPTRPRSCTSLCGGERCSAHGDRVAAPTGTFVFAPPGVKRTAFAEEPETTVIALGGTPGVAYEPDGWESLAPAEPALQGRRVRRGGRSRAPTGRGSSAVRPAKASTTSPVARASRAGRVTRSITSDSRSTARSNVARTRRMIRTSIRSAMSPRSRR